MTLISFRSRLAEARRFADRTRRATEIRAELDAATQKRQPPRRRNRKRHAIDVPAVEVAHVAPDMSAIEGCIVCRDGTIRPVEGYDPLRGLRKVAVDQVKAKLITVAEPVPDRRFRPGTDVGDHELRERLNCIALGISRFPKEERDDRGRTIFVREDIPVREAVKRYGRFTQEMVMRKGGGGTEP